MHSIAEFGSNVPAFLGKLWKMVEDPDTNDLITWSLTGTSFLIKDEIRFARELLPMYYKHNNMASFIRQLNMYGFHKIVSPEAGSMKMGAPEEVQFSHPCFVRGHAFMLENIKRKIGVSKNIDTISGAGDKPPQLLSKVLSDMRQMKGRQENMEGRLTSMKLENATLWRELSVLRQKHIKQQQIVNKLIQFLVSIVHQNQNTLSVKRKVFPRMLQHHHRHRKHHLDVEDCATSSATSPGGPVIHELDPTEALLEDVVEEAESITPITETPVISGSDYFLNQHNEDEEQGSFDVSSEPLVLNETGETIIGIPEDTLIINVKDKPKQNHKQMVINNRSAPIIIPSVHVKSEESAKPKTLKIIKKRPTKNETNLMMQPSQIALQRPALKQTVSAQPQVNNKEIVKNNQVLHGRRRNTKKTQLRKLNLNLQDKLLGFQKQNTVENQNQEINSLPINSNSLLKTDQGAVSAQQLVKSNTVPQRKQGLISVEQPQSIALTQVITVPYDSGHNEDEEQGSFDVSSEPLVLNETGETIIGIPEDTLIINVKGKPKQNHKQMVINNSSAPIIIPSVHVKSEESAKPKTFKKRPTKNETNLMMQPSQITLQRPALKQTVSAQPQVNNKEIVKNNQVLHGRRRNTKKTQLRKLNLNLQDKLLGFQKQNTVENQNQEINALPINSNSLLKTDQGAVSAQQLVKSNTVPQRKQGLISVEQPQSIALTQVITVPYDSGVCETILPDTTSNTMDSIILPMDSEEFSMPLAVDSTLPDSRRIVASPDPVLTTCVTNPSPQFLPPPDNTALPKTSSPSPSQDLQLARMDDSQVSHSPNLVSSNEMDNHLESVQSDLDSLKELLRSEGISLDANTLLGCFNEDPLSYNIMTNPNSEQDQLLKENNGNELMAYSPSLFDLTDLMGNDWNLPSPGAQQPAEDMFAEVNTPPFVPQSPTYPVPAKKRKK